MKLTIARESKKRFRGDDDLLSFIRSFRRGVKKAGVKHLATYRSIERIHKLVPNMDISDVLRIALLKNLTNDDIKIILESMDLDGSNKYYRAMRGMIR